MADCAYWLGGVSASRLRDVDALIAQLLREIEVSMLPPGNSLIRHLVQLRNVLATRYCGSLGCHSRELLRELSRVIDKDIRPRIAGLSQAWNKSELLDHLVSTFGAKIDVRAEPYVRGAGLALRGFFCRTGMTGDRAVIFLNTAHLPFAIATTFGHELGHYIYSSLTAEAKLTSAFIEGDLHRHLEVESEFFADSLVALAAYDRAWACGLGAMDDARGGSAAVFVRHVRKALDLIGPRYKLELGRRGRMASANRMRYLSSMIHFLKLRRALFEYADL